MKKSSFYKLLEDNRISEWPEDLKEAIYTLTKKYPVLTIDSVSEKLNWPKDSLVHYLNKTEEKENKQ